MKLKRAVMVVSGLSHVLAWAAFLWFAFWPNSYSGTATTPIGPDGSGGEVVNLSASLVEVNGWWVLIPLAVPVVLTAAGLLAAITWERHRIRSKVFLWASATLLVVFCGLGLASIGIFYLPAALALLAAAIIASFLPRGLAVPR